MPCLIEPSDITNHFLICFAQTKITLFILVNNWVRRENESFLLVEPCSRVTCCIEKKLRYFFRKYIFICTIYTLLMQLISTRVKFIVAATLGKTYGLRYQIGAMVSDSLPIGKPRAIDNMASMFWG